MSNTGEGTGESSSQSLSCSPSSSVTSSTTLFGFEHDKARQDAQVSTPRKREELKQGGAIEGASTERAHKARPTEEEFSPERYLLWHKRVLLHRARVGAGRSHEMCRLYNFWLAFLPDKFNDAMYQALKRYAEEDASAGHTYGLTCLFHFYLRYLSQDFEPEVYQDFETLALKYQDYLDYEEGMDCLCHFLAGASAAQGNAQPSSGREGPLPLTASHPSIITEHAQSSASAALTTPLLSASANGNSEPSSFSASVLLPMGIAISDPLTAPSPAIMPAPTTAGPPPMARGFPSFSGSAASSMSSGMLLVPPGLPRDAGVEVNPRVLEQLHAWQVARAASLSMYGYGDDGSGGMHSDAPPAESITGSSEAGGENDNGAGVGAHAQLPKRLGRRPNGKLVQAMRRASARCPSPHTPPPPGTATGPAHSAGSAPPAAGKYMPGTKAGSSPSSAPGAGVPPGARTKRNRGPKGISTTLRTSATLPTGLAGSDAAGGLAGTSPPSRHAHSVPPSRGKARKSPRKSLAPPMPHASHNFSFQGAGKGHSKGQGTGGSSGPGATDSMEVPLWEAQPCGATCGAAAAEIAKVLPLRLGELFGD